MLISHDFFPRSVSLVSPCQFPTQHVNTKQFVDHTFILLESVLNATWLRSATLATLSFSPTTNATEMPGTPVITWKARPSPVNGKKISHLYNGMCKTTLSAREIDRQTTLSSRLSRTKPKESVSMPFFRNCLRLKPDFRVNNVFFNWQFSLDQQYAGRVSGKLYVKVFPPNTKSQKRM